MADGDALGARGRHRGHWGWVASGAAALGLLASCILPEYDTKLGAGGEGGSGGDDSSGGPDSASGSAGPGSSPDAASASGAGGGGPASVWGNAAWSAHLATHSASPAGTFSVGVSPTGLAVTGSFSETLTFPGSSQVTLSSPGIYSLFFGAADLNGAFSSGMQLGTSGTTQGVAVGARPTSKLLALGGSFDGTVNLSETLFTNDAGSGPDAFITTLSGPVVSTWSQVLATSLPPPSAAIVRAIAVDDAGNAYITGDFSGVLTMPDKVTSYGSSGAQDIFVIKLGSTGTVTWSKVFSSSLTAQARGIAIDPASGNVFVTGSFTGSFVTDLKTLPSAGDSDAFVMGLDASDAAMGTLLWVTSLGGAGQDTGAGVVATPVGVVAVGSFAGNVAFGATPRISAGALDIFAVTLDAAGTLQNSQQIGGPAAEEAAGVAVDALGQFVVTGKSITDNDANVFLGKLDAATNPLCMREYGDMTAPQAATGIAADGEGRVYVIGWFTGALDLGASTGPLHEASGYNIFLAKFPDAPCPTL